jgi:hypothetical protein
MAGAVWIRRGERAVLPGNHGRLNVTLNGALSWPAREVITHEATKITGPEMGAFFAQIEARYPFARTLTLVITRPTTGLRSCASGSQEPAPPGARRLPAALGAEPEPHRAAVVVLQEDGAWNTHCRSLADFRAADEASSTTSLSGRPNSPPCRPTASTSSNTSQRKFPQRRSLPTAVIADPCSAGCRAA